ncbi:MAG: winged helix-turn-helix domain-containing protein [Candidatus Hodarchaeales archaeon]|jgi:DNA-binding transcriptional ArsR family regulator
MVLKKYNQIFEALDNERRLELYEHILQKIFISKSELAIKFDLKRASLNHHLNIMLKAGLVHEKTLILDGRRQSFIVPAVKLHPELFVERIEEYQKLVDQLNEWTKRNLTVDTWRMLREELDRLDIRQTLVEAVEIRLFPALGKRASTTVEYCYICRIEGAQVSCHICKNLVCKLHTQHIKRDQQETIILCPNCVEKFFG